MIQTTELRFGNKIQTKQGQIITVQQILCDTIIYESKIELKKSGAINITEPPEVAGCNFELNEVVEAADCSEIYPIALTEEILQQCGFRKYCREEWIISIGNSHIDFVYTDGVLRLRCMASPLSNTRYVHQLQNLIFTISGHELAVEMIEIAK